MTNKPETLSVINCARCGGEHHDLPLKYFEIPIIDPEDTWDSWAMCPVSGDPILVQHYEKWNDDGIKKTPIEESQ